MKKGYLAFAQDMRGHFVIGKAFTSERKAEEYKDFLYRKMDTPMGLEYRYVDDVDVVEIEIDDTEEEDEDTSGELRFAFPFKYTDNDPKALISAIIQSTVDLIIPIVPTETKGNVQVLTESIENPNKVNGHFEKKVPYYVEIEHTNEFLSNEEIDRLNAAKNLEELLQITHELGGLFYIKTKKDKTEDNKLWENVSLFEITKEEIEINEVFMNILKIMNSFHPKVASHLTYSIDVMNVRSYFYKDYNYDVEFTIKNKEEQYEIGVYSLGLNPLRGFPLHIIYDDETILCNNAEELTTKLEELFETKFKEIIN